MIMHGTMEILIFGESGDIIESTILKSDDASFCRIPKGIIHMDLPQEESLHLEVTSGPFNPMDNLIPDWFGEVKRDQLLKRNLRH